MINKHRHHIHSLLVILVGSLSFVFLVVLWGLEFIPLPASAIDYGRSLSTVISKNPTATAQLNLAFHRQEHSLSCEAATVKMVLDYYGLNISEAELLKNMPFQDTLRSGDVWGDPNKGFVGDIDGKMGVDGYGIHWFPIAELISKWKKSEVIEGGLAGDLVEHISEGRPIIIWGYLGRGRLMSWWTPEGNKINAINGEHTFVVYGYDGPSDNPKGFFLMDPIYGPIYWEKAKLLRNWDAFGRSGVVIYP